MIRYTSLGSAKYNVIAPALEAELAERQHSRMPVRRPLRGRHFPQREVFDINHKWFARGALGDLRLYGIAF